MGRPVGLECIRCGARHALTDYAEPCPKCRPAAFANLTVRYEEEPLAGVDRRALAARPPTMWRYAEALPVEAEAAVSLGEGFTPLVPAPRLARELGIRALHIKDESRNPTWSFKDRMASAAISAARALGAGVIASSSSGNAGAAVAAYAARAGMPCVVITFQGTAGPMLTQMRAYGAMVLAVRDKGDRWPLVEAGVRRRGWFPTSPFSAPAVGSNPFGVEGYKTLAYEVVEQLGWRAPDWCVLPVCYGDALYGMWKGFDDLARWGWLPARPRMVAAEIYGSLAAALVAGGDAVPEMARAHDTRAVSIGTTRSTYQALHALRASGGVARVVSDEALVEWQRRLATAEGLYAELSAVAALAAVQTLREDGTIGAGDTVVVVSTAGGLKDPATTERGLGEMPLIDPTVEAMGEALSRCYGYR